MEWCRRHGGIRFRLYYEMATTDDVREWYHEGIVLNHEERGTVGYRPKCDHSAAPEVAFPLGEGRMFYEIVHPFTVEAFEAYSYIMSAMGVYLPLAGGVNHCRLIAGTDWPSLHAYLVAIDLPPNEYKPDGFIAAVEAIRTNSGVQVFRNLRKDRMHDQIDCSPADLASGVDWSTVYGWEEKLGSKRVLVDIAFALGVAEGDRTYWYELDESSAEWKNLQKAARQGVLRLRAAADQALAAATSAHARLDKLHEV